MLLCFIALARILTRLLKLILLFFISVCLPYTHSMPEFQLPKSGNLHLFCSLTWLLAHGTYYLLSEWVLVARVKKTDKILSSAHLPFSLVLSSLSLNPCIQLPFTGLSPKYVVGPLFSPSCCFQHMPPGSPWLLHSRAFAAKPKSPGHSRFQFHACSWGNKVCFSNINIPEP